MQIVREHSHHHVSSLAPQAPILDFGNLQLESYVCFHTSYMNTNMFTYENLLSRRCSTFSVPKKGARPKIEKNSLLHPLHVLML